MLAAPLMTQEGAIGVVVVSKVGIGQFGEDDLKVLKLVAALATVAVESARNQAEQREAAEVSEALLELAAALSLQSSVDGIARMVALALDRLMQCAGISVWLRDGGDLVPAALVGYTPREDERLMRLRLPASAEPLGPALLTRRVMVVNVDEAPVLAGCLDAAPAGHDVRADRRRRALGEPRADRRPAGAAARPAGAARRADAAGHRRPGAARGRQPGAVRRARDLVPGDRRGAGQRARPEGQLHQRPRPGAGRHVHSGGRADGSARRGRARRQLRLRAARHRQDRDPAGDPEQARRG